MARLKTPADVHYLCFEGGGGLGFAFIGAAQGLEDLGILPVRPGAAIKGISGTSAGAITALFLAMGAGSVQLRELFADKQEFEAFYDAPAKDHCRGLEPGNHAAKLRCPSRESEDGGLLRTIETIARRLDEMKSDEGALALLLRGTVLSTPLGVLLLALVVARTRSATRDLERQVPFLKTVFARPLPYLANAIGDRGLFPGFAVREFLVRKVRSLAARHPAWRRGNVRDPAQVTFAAFRQLTGVDLAICATNVSQRRSFTFSAAKTPLFPVLEAVGMSACYPGVFKPIYIRSGANDAVLGPLRGLWLDGGILNNIPVHAFDEMPSMRARARNANAVPLLNPNVLALRLVGGKPGEEVAYRDPEQDITPLAGLAGDLLSTLLVPGREGQFRTREEQEQSIKLHTYDLSLFEFAPTETIAGEAVRQARTTVVNWFRRG